MNFYRDGNIMTVFCGRNDNETNKHNIILDDIWILKIINLEW